MTLSSRAELVWPWVCASGALGMRTWRLSGLKAGTFTVRLYFVEPQHDKAGARVLDVGLQGKPVLTNFDVFAEAQGKMKGLVKEFTDVRLDGHCSLSFSARKGQSLLSGVELVSKGMPLDTLPEKASLQPTHR